MGACYTVIIKPKFKDNDPKSFCDVIKEKTTEWKISGERHPKRSLWADPSKGKLAAEIFNLDDPLECFKLLTAEDVYEDEKEGSWSADFDASYGWESVLMDIFAAAAEVLDEGSEIYIEPDNYWTKIYVKDGAVAYEYSPDDDEEEEDE